jgi:hypothetical protein
MGGLPRRDGRGTPRLRPGIPHDTHDTHARRPSRTTRGDAPAVTRESKLFPR